jgi:uncharacterized protein YbjQ (UPF0145 family)
MHGVPQAARQRIEHQRASGVRASLFSTPAAAAAKSAALEPVGEVFGCLVMNLGYAGGGCNWWSGYGSGYSIANAGSGTYGTPVSPVTTSGRGGKNSSYTPYVAGVEAAWNGSLQRMLAEAKALGAHGVVGVKIERTLLDAQSWEFTALGTAVRSTDHMVAPRRADGEVWCTNLTAEDTASAILSGFIPHEIVLGMSVSTKHEDWQLLNQRTGWDNQEVEGMTQLIQAARNEARERLAAKATHVGGAELVITDMDLYEFETPCGTNDGRDFHAESGFIGTTLVPVPRFYRKPPESSLVMTVLPLRDN